MYLSYKSFYNIWSFKNASILKGSDTLVLFPGASHSHRFSPGAADLLAPHLWCCITAADSGSEPLLLEAMASFFFFYDDTMSQWDSGLLNSDLMSQLSTLHLAMQRMAAVSAGNMLADKLMSAAWLPCSYQNLQALHTSTQPRSPRSSLLMLLWWQQFDKVKMLKIMLI